VEKKRREKRGVEKRGDTYVEGRGRGGGGDGDDG
jgi:hypothetical protein